MLRWLRARRPALETNDDAIDHPGRASGERFLRTVDPVVGAILIGAFAIGAGALLHAGSALAAPALDVLLATLTSALAFGVALLATARTRARVDSMPIFQAAAFLVLCVGSLGSLYMQLTGPAARLGTGTEPAAPALSLVSLAPMLAGGLLCIGAIAALRDLRPTHRQALALGPVVALVVALLAVELAHSPLALSVATTATADQAQPFLSMPWIAPAIHLISAILFAIASGLAFVVYSREKSLADGYLVVALAFVVFSQAQAAIGIENRVGEVTAADFVRVAFYTVLLAGLTADVRQTFSKLREANHSLELLRNVEVERAALEERARLSRELHDGLAQNLWIAKLKAGRMLTRSDLPSPVRELGAEVMAAIEGSLTEARHAVLALRVRGPGTFAELMTEYIDDFSDSFGVRAEFACDDDLPRLDPRSEAELMRIAQEALNNTRRHADASLVHVEARVAAGELHLMVSDNGHGFAAGDATGRGFGLTSMRERAAIIGGILTVASRPDEGTKVSVVVPLARVANAEPAP